jgi:hypothetical protein
MMVTASPVTKIVNEAAARVACPPAAARPAARQRAGLTTRRAGCAPRVVGQVMGEDQGMPAVSRIEELREAVADFAVSSLDLPFESAALGAARTSLDEAGLLLLGEVHGVAENPLLVRDLIRALQISSLALEWPVGLAETVESFLHTGTLTDHCLLWLGDGRLTTGHLSMLRVLHAAGPLRLTLFDPPLEASTGADAWARRDAAMAAWLLTSAAAHTPTLVVAGNAHTPTATRGHSVPLGAHLAAGRPAVRGIHLRYRAGSFYNLAPRRFHRRPRLRDGLYATGDRLFAELPTAHEAVVPHQPSHHPTGPA